MVLLLKSCSYLPKEMFSLIRSIEILQKRLITEGEDPFVGAGDQFIIWLKV